MGASSKPEDQAKHSGLIEPVSTPARERRRVIWRAMGLTTLWPYPFAVLVAAVYRFPIPFDESGDGIRGLQAWAAFLTVAFVEAIGGVVVTLLCGVAVGLAALAVAKGDFPRANRIVTIGSAGVAGLFVVWFATMHLFVGSW